MEKPLTKKQKSFLKILKAKACNISSSCEAFGIERLTHYRWLVNLDIAQLKFRKHELESKLKMQVLENVLALERAERNVERIHKKLTMLHKRTRFINSEYENGERDFDSVMKCWEVDEDLEKSKLEMLDQVEFERARLEGLVGVF